MKLPVRKSPRLKTYDYSLCGAYFLTICTYHHQQLLGNIVFDNQGNAIELSEIGLIVQNTLEGSNKRFPDFEIIKYSIMPNHIHILLEKLYCDSNQTRTISDFVCAFKSLATKEIRLKHPGIKIWKKSFHDHIIRDERDFARHWNYIEQNVNNWQKDIFYKKKEEYSS